MRFIVILCKIQYIMYCLLQYTVFCHMYISILFYILLCFCSTYHLSECYSFCLIFNSRDGQRASCCYIVRIAATFYLCDWAKILSNQSRFDFFSLSENQITSLFRVSGKSTDNFCSNEATCFRFKSKCMVYLAEPQTFLHILFLEKQEGDEWRRHEVEDMRHAREEMRDACKDTAWTKMTSCIVSNARSY